MKQKEILKTLGYKETCEDGASYENPNFIWEDRYVWKGTSFLEILVTHNEKVARKVISDAVQSVGDVKSFG